MAKRCPIVMMRIRRVGMLEVLRLYRIPAYHGRCFAKSRDPIACNLCWDTRPEREAIYAVMRGEVVLVRTTIFKYALAHFDAAIEHALSEAPAHATLEFLQTEDGKAWKRRSQTAQKNLRSATRS